MKGGGSIVNVRSIDALAAINGLTSYYASQCGLRGLVEAAAHETARDGAVFQSWDSLHEQPNPGRRDV